MSTSSNVTAGTNATAQQYNDLRSDAILQHYNYFLQVKGTVSVANDQDVIVVPAGMTITKIKHKCESGSATIRLQKDTSDVKAGMSVGNSYTNETSGLTNTNASEGEELRLDVTAASSCVDLRVMVYAERTI